MRAGHTSQSSVSLAGLIGCVNEMYSVRDLAHTPGYLDQHHPQWVVLRSERPPDVDLFSFEERPACLKALPEPEKGFRRICPNFRRRYFIEAFIRNRIRRDGAADLEAAMYTIEAAGGEK